MEVALEKTSNIGLNGRTVAKLAAPQRFKQQVRYFRHGGNNGYYRTPLVLFPNQLGGNAHAFGSSHARAAEFHD